MRKRSKIRLFVPTSDEQFEDLDLAIKVGFCIYLCIVLTAVVLKLAGVVE